jgi:hypothetical protein
MQIHIAVGASHEPVIRVFDHKRVVTTSDKFDEDLVALADSSGAAWDRQNPSCTHDPGSDVGPKDGQRQGALYGRYGFA